MQKILPTRVAMLLALLLAIAVSGEGARVTPESVHSKETSHEHSNTIKKVLFIGDSMTGWMAERLNAYGVANGFEVSTIVWDGSTIKKWGNNNAKLKQIIARQNPDAVFISLGLNESYVTNPQTTLNAQFNNILSAVGDRKLLWIGPPSWPGKNIGKTLDTWLAGKLGADRYYSSLGLKLPRQSTTNPHPTRAGIITWMDEVVKWIPNNTSLNFKSLNSPGDKAMSRSKSYIYKRMRETL